MNLKNLMLERRTTHQFRADPVSEEILKEMFEVAVHAPNHKLTNPWKFFRLKKETRKKLGALAAQIKTTADGKEVTPALVKAGEDKFLNCAELIVLAIVRSGKPIQEKEDYASMACAVQNMSLYLWDKKIGSKWSTGNVPIDPQTYELLKIEAAQFEIVGFLWIGYPKEIPAKSKKLDLSSILEIR